MYSKSQTQYKSKTTKNKTITNSQFLKKCNIILLILLIQMKGSAQDVQIDSNITYSLKANCFNKSIKLVNHSPLTYVFKIKTNQKTVVSLQTTHDFLLPNATRLILIKLADKPSQTGLLKLQFNYAVANDQDILNKDSKMTSYPKQNIFKKIITIERNEEPETEQKTQIKKQTSEIHSMEKSFSSPVKTQQTQITYPHIDTNKLELEKPSKPITEHAESIDISELIKLQKSAEFTIQKQQSQPQKEQQSSKKISLPDALITRRVESEEIRNIVKEQSQKQEYQIKAQSPIKTVTFSPKKQSQFAPQPKKEETSSLRNSSNSDNIFVSMLDSSKRQSAFRMTESVVVQIPAQNKQKNEGQIAINELNEKIEKEKKAINSLAKNQQAVSVYPLPIILLGLVVSFSIGSLISWSLA